MSRYNNRHARELQQRANVALVLAGGAVAAGGAALAGSGGGLYTFHYMCFGIAGALVAAAFVLMRAALRAEVKSGKYGIVYPPREPLRYQPPVPRSGYVPPVLPTAPGGPVNLPPIPAGVYLQAPVLPVVVPAPAPAAPVPVPAEPAPAAARVAPPAPADPTAASQYATN